MSTETALIDEFGRADLNQHKIMDKHLKEEKT